MNITEGTAQAEIGGARFSFEGMKKTSLILGLALLLLAGSSQAESPLLPELAESNPVIPDFSYAGYGFGELPLPTASGTLLSVDDFGAIANDSLDDSQAILRALEAARQAKGAVTLRFSAGRYRVSEILPIDRSHLVLAGAGSDSAGTILEFPRPLRMADRTDWLDELRQYLREQDKQQVEPPQNIDLPFSEYSWSGAFIWVKAPQSRPSAYLESADPDVSGLPRVKSGTAFQTAIEMEASAPAFRAGDLVRLEWYAQDGKSSALLNSLYGENLHGVGEHHWKWPNRPPVVQLTRVESVEGKRLTLANPLMHDINHEMPATLQPFVGLQEVGIRDLAIEFPEGASFGHHLEEGFNGIQFSDLFNGWADNLRISNADSGILTYNSANLTLRNIRTEGKRRAHYAVHLGNVHNVLVSDLIISNPLVHALTFNTQSTRSVYQRATVYSEPALDQHAGANHQNLFDDVQLFVAARRDEQGKPWFPVWDGSGAPYWQPGHARYNTTWNLKVTVTSGAGPEEIVRLAGIDEGPEARLIGVSGNRRFELDYRPAPYQARVNQSMADAPSLYDLQLRRRLEAKATGSKLD